eukprot:16828_1
MKSCDARKLYVKVLMLLKKKAQRLQFGHFLSDINMDEIEKCYHHILKSHINCENKEIIKSTFKFFGRVVHYEDTGSEIDNCNSFNRRQQRVNEINSNKIEDAKEEKYSGDDHNCANKQIWNLKQYYSQSQLDIMHTFLVHSNWKKFVQRFADQRDKPNDDEIEYDINDSNLNKNNNVQNKNKYVTDLSESTVGSYGFGFEHQHPYLSPKYCSVRDELLCNSLFNIKDTVFRNLLTNAIKKHKIAMEHHEELQCTYFDSEYNILRNEFIGMRHIFSIITYSDIGKFCTAFRSTFRMTNGETDIQQVEKRHIELYHYSRSLFEAVEFFGEEMSSELHVYHGLNRVMYFQKFAAYFNQPISTTTNLTAAHNFTQGCGIILTLKSAQGLTKIPKYLSIAWISCFPHEEELLFYGASVSFQIINIHESEGLKTHAKELKLLNQFQRMISNEEVKWDGCEETKNMIDGLVHLNNYQQKFNQNQQQKIDHEETKYVRKWKNNDVLSWLKSIGMEMYEMHFRKENIHGEMLLNDINKENLVTDLSVKSIHIGTIMREINKLKGGNNELNETTFMQSIELNENKSQINDSVIKEQGITKYGLQLFSYFCNNAKTTKICIRNYLSLPHKIRNTLLVGNAQEEISLIPIAQSFKYVEEIILNDLKVQQMRVNAKIYIDAVLEYASKSKQLFGKRIEKILFQSETQNDRKPDTRLKKVSNLNRFTELLARVQWKIAYTFDTQNMHCLAFVKSRY